MGAGANPTQVKYPLMTFRELLEEVIYNWDGPLKQLPYGFTVGKLFIGMAVPIKLLPKGKALLSSSTSSMGYLVEYKEERWIISARSFDKFCILFKLLEASDV